MDSELHAHGLSVHAAGDLLPTGLLDELAEQLTVLPVPPPSERKPYMKQWLGRFPKHDPTSVWTRIADVLHPIAQAYLETARLYYYNLWQSLVTDQPARDSQLWHQDIEDTRLLKAFLYLTDVTDGAGPLTYIPDTHWRGSLRIEPKVTLQRLHNGPPVARVTDAAMARCVSSEDWRTLLVPKGTLVFADTTGWHKGGHATTTERFVAVWEWTTPKCRYPSRLQ